MYPALLPNGTDTRQSSRKAIIPLDWTGTFNQGTWCWSTGTHFDDAKQFGGTAQYFTIAPTIIFTTLALGQHWPRRSSPALNAHVCPKVIGGLDAAPIHDFQERVACTDACINQDMSMSHPSYERFDGGHIRTKLELERKMKPRFIRLL